MSRLCSGGRQGKLPVTAFEAFDLETRSWTRYPCVPSRRAFAACAMVDGVVFSLGGLQQPGPHNFYSRPHFVNTVEMFDPAQGELHVPRWGGSVPCWSRMPPWVLVRGVHARGTWFIQALSISSLHPWRVLPCAPWPWEPFARGCPGLGVWRGAPAGDAHTLSPPGAWSKPSRAIRMREKRADFVAGCLGGRVVAVGGLGNAGHRHMAVFPSLSFVAHQ